jgi:myo-inositol-1(or 4)-monophosphatase
LELIRAVRSIRAGGSCAQELAYLASGRIDVVFAPAQSAWDFAAGVLLLEEAGGTVSDARGLALRPASVQPKGQDVVASNGLLHSWILEGLAEAPPNIALEPTARN